MYIYGKNVAKEATNVEKVYVSKNFKDKELLNNINAPIVVVDNKKLDDMVKGNHQGIVLKVSDYEYASIEEILFCDIIVMLDHLNDPHNLGAIIRTCEAAGIKGIIIPKDRSVEVNSTVIKVSVGTIEQVKVCQVTNLVNTIKYLKEKNYWVIGTDMNGTDYTKLDYNGKIVIVIGNEETGMSDLVKRNCDFIASIPMLGTTNSLNASVATGIILFQAIRR